MGTDTELPLDAGAALTQNWIRPCLCCRDNSKPPVPGVHQTPCRGSLELYCPEFPCISPSAVPDDSTSSVMMRTAGVISNSSTKAVGGFTCGFALTAS